jgi:DNA-binding LytR/AlgR family response regulator
MRCAIVDDEPLALGILKDYVDRVPLLECVGVFSNALEALAFVEQGGVDLLFLDINMPELTGLQLLRALSHPPRVILTTAYAEHALVGYDLDVVDYLLKPIEFERFLKAVNKAHTLVLGTGSGDAGDRSILLKSGNKLHPVALADVQYAQAAGNYVSFCTAGKEILSLMTMKDAGDLLTGGGFVRVHRSYFVNLRHVEVVDDEGVVVGRRRIPVADSQRDELIRALRARRC